jgi:hypothetical protein
VDELDPPQDLRAPVFAEASRLFSGKQVMLQPAGPIAVPASFGVAGVDR